MKSQLQSVFLYHEQTKHSPGRYARSLGYMDWSNQPHPFRTYNGAMKIDLPLAVSDTTPPYYQLFDASAPSALPDMNALAQLMQFSMGLSAIKSNGFDEWALRCNASSGNLHPTESYLIIPPFYGISMQTDIVHYAPKHHAIEVLSSFDTSIWKDLKEGSFFIALSSIVYREVWKYGERAFRYTQLDVGHAMRSIQISAKTLGWHAQLITTLHDTQIAHLLGLDQRDRFHPKEDEIPDILFLITPNKKAQNIDPSILFEAMPFIFDSAAAPIATAYQDWPIIKQIENATLGIYSKNEQTTGKEIAREITTPTHEILLKRRSAQMMDKNNSHISKKELLTLLTSTDTDFDLSPPSVHLVLFIHNVAELPSGIYIYLRNSNSLQDLQQNLDKQFLWHAHANKLYLLQEGDFRFVAKAISCSQDIACDGAFSLGMLAPFSEEILQYGAHRYKELYWECGAIGQQLYLEATSLGLSATGIGCFLDDMFHEIIGLKTNKYQSLYHFTVGRGLFDNRILTKKPYQDRE